MKFHQILAIAIAGSALSVMPAFAITVTNQDKTEHTFTIDQGEAQVDQKVAAGASTEIECTQGCELRVRGSGYGRSVETGDKLIINEEGTLHFASEPAVTTSISDSNKDKLSN